MTLDEIMNDPEYLTAQITKYMQRRKAPSVSVYDYSDHCCDGIGWD